MHARRCLAARHRRSRLVRPEAKNKNYRHQSYLKIVGRRTTHARGLFCFKTTSKSEITQIWSGLISNIGFMHFDLYYFYMLQDI